VKKHDHLQTSTGKASLYRIYNDVRFSADKTPYNPRFAAKLGLPFAFASHFAPSQLLPALHLYHSAFEPSDFLDEPYAMACVNVIAADTDSEAQYLASSFYQLVLGMIRNTRRPLPPPTGY
jgi:alkanesulfonate monooxygenase SsuD/methylene tetrahydromethanopterin reductase-like flavin-dependent oxidoreductase (luciferase family)